MKNQLVTSELFEEALMKPVEEGGTELYVVSGYASAAMVTHHLERVRKEYSAQINIDLVVGMAGRDGITKGALLGFQSIPRQASGSNFSCAFSLPQRSVHSKVYVWNNERGPFKAFVGSANYTQFGFGLLPNKHRHLELLTEVNPQVAFDYVLDCGKETVDYRNSEIYKYLPVLDNENRHSLSDFLEDEIASSNGESVTLPLVQAAKQRGEIHQRSGLNWGQREGRNPNQAYLPIPNEIRDSGFFPPRGVHFQIITSDGEAFIATVAQDGSKAIETPSDNSIIGKYFRKRLGLQEGVFVDTIDLLKFGSTGVKITKLDEENFRLTFEPGIEAFS